MDPKNPQRSLEDRSNHKSTSTDFDKHQTTSAWTFRDDFMEWVEHATASLAGNDNLNTANSILNETSRADFLLWLEKKKMAAARPVDGRALTYSTFPDLAKGCKDLSLRSTPSSAPSSETGHKPPAKFIFVDKAQPLENNPSGNWRKAIQVVACFCAYMNSWGPLNSYGVFQSYYSSKLLPTTSPLQLAWIGSTQAFLLLLVSVCTGPAIDAGYLRTIMVLGTVIYALGLITLSFCTQFYQLVLAQGVAVGIGAGCIFLPCITVPPQWFSKAHRTTVLGIVSAGSSVGGMIFPTILKTLLPNIGFAWTVRVIACIVLVLNVFSTVVLCPRNTPSSRRKLFNKTMFRDVKYVLLCAAAFLGFMGLYIPVFFIEEYARQHARISPELASYLVTIVMAGSLPGRLVPNIVAEKLQNPLTLLTAITFSSSLLCFMWTGLGTASSTGIVGFALLYGFTSGAYAALTPPVVVALAPNLQGLGTRLGMVLEAAAFGCLVGSPVAGALLTRTGTYLGLQCFAGGTMMLAVGLLVVVWVMNRKHA